jgi:hypothetical protein
MAVVAGVFEYRLDLNRRLRASGGKRCDRKALPANVAELPNIGGVRFTSARN